MKAVVLVAGTKSLRLADRPEPTISTPDDIKLAVLDVGICGTDREEAAGGRADPPPGESELVIGHEMFGRVVDAGSAVSRVRVGDLGLFTVRRGCARCEACLLDRSDMCLSGEYTERGIKGADGYNADSVVDREQYFIPVPSKIANIAVLTEPMSIAQKAMEEASSLQGRRLSFLNHKGDWFSGKHVLVAGLGPVGLLAAIALRLRGAVIFGLDVVEENNPRVVLLKAIGGTYVDGRESMPDAIAAHYGSIDVVFEATGVAHLEFDLIEALGANGIYMLTGIPGGDRPIEIDGASLVRKLVLDNQVLVGSVNASHANFKAAVRDLVKARQVWGDVIDRMITARLPASKFLEGLTQHRPEEIKTVLRWADY